MTKRDSNRMLRAPGRHRHDVCTYKQDAAESFILAAIGTKKNLNDK